MYHANSVCCPTVPIQLCVRTSVCVCVCVCLCLCASASKQVLVECLHDVGALFDLNAACLRITQTKVRERENERAGTLLASLPNTNINFSIHNLANLQHSPDLVCGLFVFGADIAAAQILAPAAAAAINNIFSVLVEILIWLCLFALHTHTQTHTRPPL